MDISTTFRVGDYTLELSFLPDRCGLQAKWSPEVPKKPDLTVAEWKQYYAGRDAFLDVVEGIIGTRIVVAQSDPTSNALTAAFELGGAALVI